MGLSPCEFDQISNTIRTDFSFDGSPDSDNDIITNVPINGWAPIGVVGNSTPRVGWVYDFYTNTLKNSTYWYIKPRGTSPSGDFSGRICAIKVS